jgi:inner membrane protein
VFFATASHGVLDAFTNGALGIAFFWPWSVERYFFPLRLIEMSPIGLSQFLTPRALAVLQSELVWVWLPSVVLGAALLFARRHQR